MSPKFPFLLSAAFAALTLCAAPGDEHLKQFAAGVPGDRAVKAASKLNIRVPVFVREWHIWTGVPYGENPTVPRWMHWDGEKKFGKYDPATTIEQLRPGSSWRRYLNCTGYPLLGPYDPGRPGIIRWQLETARNAGIECLYLHLWPSLWDDGADLTPQPVLERALDAAAELNYPIALHDEIAFRGSNISGAQKLENTIRRTAQLVTRYGKHPGWYKIDGMPVYYFQNWNSWIKPPELARYFAEVEKQTGPVYWVYEGADIEEAFRIPQIKAVLSHNNSWFLHTPPHGAGPHPWKELEKSMERAAKLARKYDKKFGMMIYTRFNNNSDRGRPGNGRIPAEDGMFFVDSIKRTMKFKPDFFIFTQWSDFEESAFIEPAWDFDGFNGDPYRYCRIIAAAQGKKFVPAPLPPRDEVDPYIRRKLYGGSEPGDLGPVCARPVLRDGALTLKWAEEGPEPAEVRLVQNELARWTPEERQYTTGQKLRLANWSAVNREDEIEKAQELRFYAPGLTERTATVRWVGIRHTLPPGTSLVVNYRSVEENFRIDSRWERRELNLRSGVTIPMADGSTFSWVPAWGDRFSGEEGDLLIRLGGKREKSRIHEIVVWSPEMAGSTAAPGERIPLPREIDPSRPFAVVPYDRSGAPGIPHLLISIIAGERK